MEYSNQTIQILDKTFCLEIPKEKIKEAVLNIANKINWDFAGQEVIFTGILNGSFMFAADLLKNINLKCRISFMKLASYTGSKSSGEVKQLIGLNENIENKVVIVVEDIVDSGLTLQSIIQTLSSYKPSKLVIATLLYKPEACRVKLPLDYIGMEIPNDFIVGYGLDYNGYGRNLQDIYKVSEE